MKQLLLFLFISTILQTTYGQTTDLELDVETPKQHTIWLETYKPIYVNAIRALDNEQVLDVNQGKYERKASSYGLGFAYEHMFEKNIVFRSRFGISKIKITEESLFESTRDEIGETESYKDEAVYEYEQRHFNMFFGIVKRISISKNLNIDIGADYANIFYGKGKGEYLQKTETISDFYIERMRVESNFDYGKLRSIGFGPILKPEYVLPTGLSFSIELQMFFTKIISKDDTIIERTENRIITQNNGGGQSTSSAYNYVETRQEFSEWSWSEISPLLRVGYRF